MEMRGVEVMLARHELRHAELAAAMGVDPSTLSKKLAGARSWKQEDINRALEFFRSRGHAVTYEELFAAPVSEALA